MIIRNDNDLIGDFIGTIPAMQALGADVIIRESMVHLFNMTGLKRAYINEDLSFDLHAAFELASRENLHMIQANFAYADLPVPQDIPKPILKINPCHAPVFDFLLAPFSRSLPPEQKWDKWQELVDAMPGKQFALLGDPAIDPVDFIKAPNITPQFGHSMDYVCNLLKNSKHGLISVVTGISHLAHALGVTNYLFFNQGRWGQNPDAVLFDKHIPDIEVEEVVFRLCQQ
jgi:hypothetical protein